MPLSVGIIDFDVRGGSLDDHKSRKNICPQSSIPESLNRQSSTRFYTKKCPKGAPRSTPEYPRRSQRAPKGLPKYTKNHEKSDPAPKWHPKGLRGCLWDHPGLQNGAPGPQKLPFGTAKVIISHSFPIMSSFKIQENTVVSSCFL